VDWSRNIILLHDFFAGADRRLTETPPSDAEGPAGGLVISPDGKKLAYGWHGTSAYEVRIINTDGTGMRVLLVAPKDGRVFPRAWSPDGKQILATQVGPEWAGIALISASDGAVRALKSVSPLEAGDFSPDGKYVTYIHQTDGVWRTYILSADGKSEAPLISGPYSSMGGTWSSDGSRIMFSSNRDGSKRQWSVRVADGKPQGEPEPFKADTRGCLPMGFARDGSLFCYVSSSSSNIYLAGLDPATGKLTSEPKRVNERSIGHANGRLAWLPDGRSLSFWNQLNGRTVLVVHTLATGEEREVPGITAYTGWFPDGSLMTAQRNGQTRQFRRVDIRTSEAQDTWAVPVLPSSAVATGFSRDLMTNFFARQDEAVPCEESECTYLMLARDLKTGRDRELFRIRARLLYSSTMSPDGRDLAFFALHGGELAAMIVQAAGGTPRELYRTKDSLLPGTLTWAQDGSHVLAFCDESGREAAWSFPRNGGSPEKSPLNMRIGVGPLPEVSPDGTRIAFVGDERKKEIWVMTGLFQDAKPAPAR
jgi:Tol biopolymer transport system component